MDESMIKGIRVGGALLLDCSNIFLDRLFVPNTGCAVVPPSAPTSSLRKSARIPACEAPLCLLAGSSTAINLLAFTLLFCSTNSPSNSRKAI